MAEVKLSHQAAPEAPGVVVVSIAGEVGCAPEAKRVESYFDEVVEAAMHALGGVAPRQAPNGGRDSVMAALDLSHSTVQDSPRVVVVRIAGDVDYIHERPVEAYF